MVDERRRFFRIDDTVGISYRVLTDEELLSRAKGEGHPLDAFGMIASYESRIENGLSQLRVRDPEVAAVLENINKKMNCVINQLEVESHLVQRIAHKVQEVNISACGLAFMADDAIDVGRVMSLNLMLRPTNLHISTYGTVIDCDAQPGDGGFYVRVNFQDMDPADQEVLIQHIVKRQGTLLRGVREEAEKLSLGDLK